MTQKKEKIQGWLIGIGILLIAAELLGVAAFFLWRQYTCYGAIPGIKGDVDINIYFPPK